MPFGWFLGLPRLPSRVLWKDIPPLRAWTRRFAFGDLPASPSKDYKQTVTRAPQASKDDALLGERTVLPWLQIPFPCYAPRPALDTPCP